MYCENDLVKIAKRENNSKRGYLVVDPLQGKHIPVSPTRSLKLFDELGDVLKAAYDEEMLLIGFAETATAIGAEAAVHLGTRYITTTREIIPNVEYLFFSEEHSHATQQKLVKNDIDAVVGVVSRIVFVEDEVTTGKTILNIVSIMQKLYPNKFKYAVLSLLNGMTQEHIKTYEENEISLHYLVKTDHGRYDELADKYQVNGTYHLGTAEYKNITINNMPGYVNARRLLKPNEYKTACERLWVNVKSLIGEFCGKKVLVIGTEEFMYPALYVGREIEKMENCVWSHSTTRSPIAVSYDAGYPLSERYELISLYDENRKTFIYNINEYDKVIILTDSEIKSTKGINTLYNALSGKNNEIITIRWC